MWADHMLLDWFGFCSLSDLVCLLDMAPPLSCPVISLFNGVESSGALCLYRWMNAMDVIVSMLLDWFGFCSLSDLVCLLDMAPPLSCPMISLFNGVESSGALCLYQWMNVLC
jgi:hypothetical protein